jgi:hypothetical protein
VVGTVVIFDLTFMHSTPVVEAKMRQATRDGKFGGLLQVSPDGFEIVEHLGGFGRRNSSVRLGVKEFYVFSVFARSFCCTLSFIAHDSLLSLFVWGQERRGVC